MPTIAVATGSRAEYGLLRPVLQKLARSKTLELKLLATGSHLSPAFGNTVDEIEADGFEIAARFDILSQPVPPGRAGTARRMSMALAAFLGWLEVPQNRPDALLLLGDRYEMLAAGQAAALLDIPLVHISGGDVTMGADDDWFRHCLTKMAKLHFPSCEAYRRRLMRMGEQPGRVFNVGGLGDENIRNMQLLSREALEAALPFALPGDYALVTFHPETAGNIPPNRQMDSLLEAARRVPRLFYLFTAANADAGGAEMNRRAEAFCAAHSNAAFVQSLGSLRYLSAMKHAALVLGNSSSGVVETPSLGTPTVNIGERQKGRVTGPNVVHCAMEPGAIFAAMEKALQPGFAAQAKQAKSPYNGGDTSGRIVALLEEFLQSGALAAPKEFYDGEVDA